MLTALLLAALPAQPPIPPAKDAPPALVAAKAPDVPREIKAKVGRPVTITVPAKDTGYEPVFSPERCRLARLYSDDPDVMVLEAWPFEAGEFPIVFWCAGERRGVVCKVVAGDVPGPGPKPPEPTPPPVNPYRAGLKAAFDADPGDAKAKHDLRMELVSLYAMAATLAADPAVTTTDNLRERLRRAASTLAGDQLVGTRTAIANILAPALPLGQPLTPESRAAAAGLFRQVSEGLAW